VRDVKFVVFSTCHRGYFRRVFLNYAHVPHDQEGGEAAVALELAWSIPDAADDCVGVLYDGAFRGMHRDVIARRGRLLINKQHKGTKPRYIRTISYGHCRHELWSSGGRVHERAYVDNGTSTLIPLPVRKLERRASTHTHRWYHLLTVLCPRGPHEHRKPVGVTTTPGERDEGQSDTETGFHRAEHLLQIPDDTAVHQTSDIGELILGWVGPDLIRPPPPFHHPARPCQRSGDVRSIQTVSRLHIHDHRP